MFGGFPDSENLTYKADIYLEDGSHEAWSSPDWKSMPWWLKKRYHRVMDYYELIEEAENVGYEGLCKHLALKYGPNVEKVVLSLERESTPDIPDDLGLFDPARQEMETEEEHLFTFSPDCETRAANGECKEYPAFMTRFCKRSCDLVSIVDPKEVKVGSRLSVYFEDEEEYYLATVVEIGDDFKTVFLDYDDGSESDWVDLSEYEFLLLQSSEEAATAPLDEEESGTGADEGEL